MVEFDRFTIVLLRATARPPGDDAEEARMQDAHMAHLARLHEEGALLAAGPLPGPPDRSLRGLSLFRGGPEEVRRLLDADPAVRAGALAAEILPWIVPAGAMAFTRTRFPRSMAEV